MPLASEMPTVTMVRVKGVMTGGLSAYFEISENFGSDKVLEDSLLYQVKAPGGIVVFTGDYIWTEMFKEHFDRAYPYRFST